MYDDRSVQRFDELHRIFYTWYWVSSVLAIMLSVTSGAVSGPNAFTNISFTADDQIHDTLSIIGVATGIASAVLLSIEKTVNLQRVADDCKWARSLLAYCLAEHADMSIRDYERLSNIGLLCFQFPQKQT